LMKARSKLSEDADGDAWDEWKAEIPDREK
jgi:hypothetical protein